MTPVHRRVLRAVLAMCALFLAMPAASASAHAVLDSSTPVASSTIQTSPPEIVLRFNEPVASTLAQIELFDSNSELVQIGKAKRDDTQHSVVSASVPPLAEGVYVVVWRVSSADGHPVQGAFPFEIGPISTGTINDLLNDVLSRLGKQSNVGLVVGVFRFLAFLGATVLIGVVVVTRGGALLRSRRASRISFGSLVVLTVGTLGNLLFQGPYAVRGTWSDFSRWSLISDVLHTRLGFFLVVRLVVCIAAAILLWTVHRWPHASGARQSGATLVFLALITSFSAAGHASTLSYSVVSVVIDGLHLAAISAWMGGLLALVLMSRGDFLVDSEVGGENIVARFSRHATYLLPVTVVTGVLSTLRIVDGWSGISDSTYGRMLMIKVALVLMVATLGAVARTALRRNGVQSIRRGIAVEAAIGVAILALTAGIVALSPSASSDSSGIAHVTLVQNDIIADLTFAPVIVGQSELHVIFTPPGGSLDPMVAVTARISLPEKNIPAIPIQMVALDTSHWTGSVQVPYPGQWSLQIIANPTPESQVSFSTKIRIKK